MDKVIIKEINLIKGLSPEEKDKVINDIYVIYTKLFSGWPKEKLREIFHGKEHHFFKVRLLQDKRGDVIGFIWLTGRKVRYKEKAFIVFNNVGGLSSESRKKGLITSFLTKEMISYRITHPLKKIYSYQRLIHPASYHAWVNALHEMYPAHNKKTPREITEFVSYLNMIYRYVPIDENNPFVVMSENFVTNTEQENRFWREKDDDDIRFYHQQTDFKENYALMMLFPFTFKNAFMSVSKNIRKNIRRFFQAPNTPGLPKANDMSR